MEWNLEFPINRHNKWYKRSLDIEYNLSKSNWKYVDSGRCRRVWKRNNVVLKIAYNEDGIISNKQEYYLYKHDNRGIYAPCRLIKENLLMMRAVEVIEDPYYYREDLPGWALDLIDGPQIGLLNGKYVAYDYGDEDLTPGWQLELVDGPMLIGENDN